MTFPLAGETVNISRAADGSIHNDYRGQLDPMTLGELQAALEPDTTFYTDKEVAIGEEWKGNNEALTKSFQLTGPNDRAGMTLKLLSLKDIKGRPTAEIKVSAAGFKEVQGISNQTIMQGTILVDLPTGHVLKGDLKSTATQKGTTTGPGPDGQQHRMTVEGDGTTTISLTSELLDGKMPARENPSRDPKPNPLAGGKTNPLAAPAGFRGVFTDGKLKLDLQESADGYVGTLTLGEQNFKATATEKNGTLDGKFEASGQTYPFTATRENDTIHFKTGDTAYTLKRKANPLDQSNRDLPPKPASLKNPLAGDVSPVVQGPKNTMRFESYVLKDDPSYIGGEVSQALIPAGWKVEGGVVWELSNTYFPAQCRLQVFDPKGVSSLGSYPNLYYFWSSSPMSQQLMPPGTNYMGCIVRYPIEDPIKAVRELVLPAYRKELLRARVVEQEELPKMADKVTEASEKMPGTKYLVKACRIRFEYEVDGQPVEEDLYAVLETRVIPQMQSMNWTVSNITSNRAAKGKMEELRGIQKIIERSVRPNLEWTNKYVQFVQAMHNIGMEAIHQAGVRSKIIANISNDISDTMRKSYENTQAANDRISEARSQTMRGVTPYEAGGGRKVELPSEFKQAWRTNDGQYIVSNDPNYNPNADLNNHSTWEEMHPAH